MPDSVNRHPRLLLAAILTAVVVTALGVAANATASSPNVGQLSQQLNQTQANESSLSSEISSINGQVSKLSGQISLVESREHAAQNTLASDNAAVARTRVQLAKQEAILRRERSKLAFSRHVLTRQLVSQYEDPQQTLVSVVLNSQGFNQLLSQLQYLHSAQDQQRAIIIATRKAKLATEAATARIAKLERDDVAAADRARTQTRALAGMQALLNSRQTALAHARAAKSAALEASREHGAALQSQINHIKAQEAAAAAAAAALAAQQAAAQQQSAAQQSSQSSSTPTSSGTSTATGGWAIPYAIVLCESGGQNLPPNSAGASGYYQIMPATWRGEGGTGPAAYLASKAEQDAIAAKLWDGGAGASNWVCAGIVGIH